MWLLARLAPDHKTIASFRSQNSDALVAVCAAFIQFARQEQLIAGTLVAIDGSKIRAVASKKAICDVNDLKQDRQQIQEQVSNYLAQLDQSDEQERANLLKGDVGKTLRKLETHAQDISQELQRLAQGKGKLRFVSRHQYEDTLQASALRLAQSPHMMRIRRSTVEHPFGTIKHQILGNARLLLRGLKGAKAELSLAVMAYNFKRVRNMKGCDWMMSALGA